MSVPATRPACENSRPGDEKGRTRDEMIEGLLHEITRTRCHLEDADRDLCVVAGDLDELMKTLEPSTAQLLGPFAASRSI